MLSADCASADIISYFSIYARPIYCLSCLHLHLVYPLMCSVQVGKGMMEEFQSNADSVSLEEEAGFYGQFIPDSPEMSGDPWDLLSVADP